MRFKINYELGNPVFTARNYDFLAAIYNTIPAIESTTGVIQENVWLYA